jgi:hypothetical protein
LAHFCLGSLRAELVTAIHSTSFPFDSLVQRRASRSQASTSPLIPAFCESAHMCHIARSTYRNSALQLTITTALTLFVVKIQKTLLAMYTHHPGINLNARTPSLAAKPLHQPKIPTSNPFPLTCASLMSPQAAAATHMRPGPTRLPILICQAARGWNRLGCSRA